MEVDIRDLICYGNLLDEAYKSENICIVQQTNCVALNPGGLAYDLAQYYGEAYNPYRYRKKLSNKYNYDIATQSTRDELGTVKLYPGSPNIVNLYAQYMSGNHSFKLEKDFLKSMDESFKTNIEKDKKEDRLKYFNQCLKLWLQELKKSYNNHINCVFFPYRIGCGLAGGDWEEYKKSILMFNENIPSNIKVYVIKMIPKKIDLNPNQ